jgi:uncharacterized membrane protein YkvA (DUF1232 family)
VTKRSYRGHPLAKLAGCAARLPRYLNLAQALARDGSVPVARKTALLGGLAYALSPIDLIPGIIPIVGQLDDLAALLLALRVVVNGCPPELAREHLSRVGIADTAIDADLETVREAAVWLAQGAGRLGLQVLTAPFRKVLGSGRPDHPPG